MTPRSLAASFSISDFNLEIVVREKPSLLQALNKPQCCETYHDIDNLFCRDIMVWTSHHWTNKPKLNNVSTYPI